MPGIELVHRDENLGYLLDRFAMILLQEMQRQRETVLIRRLLEIIKPYVDGHKADFLKWARDERSRLKDACKTLN